MPYVRFSILESNKKTWVAPVVPRVSGPADYTNSYSRMQSVSFSIVCVSAQQSEEMSVSGEEIDEHTQETKRLASENTQQAADTKPAVHCRFWVKSANVFCLEIVTVVFANGWLFCPV